MSDAAAPLAAGTPAQADISRLLERLYAAISFEEGHEPNWREFDELFSKHAIITRVTPEGTDHLTPTSFLEMTRSMLEIGAYTSFYEFELLRRIERFGSIAQVWSAYETRRHQSAREPLSRGLNAIQLIREDEDWRVLALLWDETSGNPNLNVTTTFSKDLIGG